MKKFIVSTWSYYLSNNVGVLPGFIHMSAKTTHYNLDVTCKFDAYPVAKCGF